jgi:hypothetical protein
MDQLMEQQAKIQQAKADRDYEFKNISFLMAAPVDMALKPTQCLLSKLFSFKFEY